MANAEHLTIRRQGVDAWNAWREKESSVRPDLIRADLHGANLNGVNLKVLVERVIPTLVAAPKQQVNIGQLTAPLAVEGIIINKGDTYNVSGQAGAVGHSAHAHGNVFQQIQAGIDLPKLAEELGRLRMAMKGESKDTPEHDEAIGAVAGAEKVAAKGDGPAALQYLKSTGEWTRGIAEKIGVPVAVEALKRVM